MVIIKKRNSSTIPFGYILSHGELEPLESQLIALKETKQRVLDGIISLRAGTVELKNKTGKSFANIFHFTRNFARPLP